MSLSPGDLLGPYEIVAPIGEGGMGEVYKARDTRLDRMVALKVSKEEFTERFEREARAVAALNHPHICQLYDVGPNYLVMELIEGTPLEGPLPLNKALAYAGQILDALAAAHAKKFTHRDLKPANILVTKRGIKLLDFGLAKQSAPLSDADATVVAGLTNKGQIVGTLQYMAPEQLQGKEADARSDLFAFGCVLFEVLTGQRAFEGKNAATIITSIMSSEPSADAIRQAAVPASVDRVLRKCLAKEPDERWQSARDLATALQWSTDSAAPILSSQAQRPRREYLWMAIAAVCAVAAVSLTILSLRRTAPEPRATRFAIEPHDVRLANRIDLSVSPDGRYIAFRGGQGPSQSSIYLRSLDSVSLKEIPGSRGAAFGAWSPDSRSVLLHRAGSVLRVDLNDSTPPVALWTLGGLRSFAWGPNGILSSSAHASGGPIFRMSESSNQQQEVTKLQQGEGGSHSYPSFLPDGRHLLYWTNSHTAVVGDINSLTGTSIVPTDAPPAYSPGPDGGSGYLLFTRASTLFAQVFDPRSLKLSGTPIAIAEPVSRFSVSSNGVLVYRASLQSDAELRWIDRNGTASVFSQPAAYAEVELSRDGKTVITDITAGGDGRSSHLFTADVARGVFRRLKPDLETSEFAPALSPDGRSVAYFANMREIHLTLADGSGSSEVLYKGPTAVHPNHWSPDGKFVLYDDHHPTQKQDLWILPLQGSRKPVPYLTTRADETMAQFSPNMKWIAYSSDESGKPEVYVQGFDAERLVRAGGKWQISTDGGNKPRWKGDGSELYYLTQDGAMMVVSIKSGATLEPAAPKKLFDTKVKGSGGFPYAVTADGQRFLVISRIEDSDSSAIQVVMNWYAALAKK